MFSQKLKDLRGDLSQYELSKILQVSRGAVGMWESGERMPSYELLLKIANYFEVSTDYLLDNENSKANRNKNELLIPDEKKATVELLCKLPDIYFANIEGRIQAYAQLCNIN